MLDKRYDFKAIENGRYETWVDSGYFKAGDKTKQKFSMVIPPPNVTGILHIGHAIDNTYQDIICRYKKACGFDVLFLPGVDHAGIATQAKVDAKLKSEGIDKYDIGREAFIKESYKWKEEHTDIIHDQWKKMGLMLDYSRERFTLDEGFKDAVYLVFKTLFDKKLIYRGERIVNYDTQMRTALSNIEIIYSEDEGSFYFFKYRFADNKDEYVEIATTRPETMFGDTCLVVNPTDKRYLNIIGKNVINPANNQIIPIIADEYVDVEFGTGVMKCTPAHDPNDFLIGQKHGLEHPVIMNIDGTMKENTGIYAGMDRFKCRELLLENTKKNDDLIKIQKIKHQVGHSERTGSVVEPILSKQWFIKMEPIAKMILDNQKTDNKINFYPKRFDKNLSRWLEKCEDWCISRQLWWGHRIPVYYNDLTEEIIVSKEVPDNSGNWHQDNDVLDTWFSSALWPFATLGWPNNTDDFERYYPTDCLVTGYDIIFFWVSRMIMQGLLFTEKRPFKDVVMHGLVRDSKGMKMSKSLGNGIDPSEVIQNYGVDSLRYFLATVAAPGLDMRYSEEKVNSSSNYLNKIWNSARYILMNIDENYVESVNDIKHLNTIDKYILTKLQETVKKVTNAMNKYDFGVASSALYNFVYDDFCSFYLEMSKVTLNQEEAEKKGTYYTLLNCLKSIIVMLYPFSPFITEEIYLNLPQHLDSIMLESYPIFDKKMVFKTVLKDVESLKEIIEGIRSFKVTNKLQPNHKVDLRLKTSSNLVEFKPYIIRFTFANSLEFVTEDVKNSTSIVLLNSTAYVLDSEIDHDKLNEQLNNQLQQIDAEILRSENMLNNPNFVNKAPKFKLDAEKDKYQKYLMQKEEILKKMK
ncbi:MAG TPA: valine--tRNA ligase [Candidatus Onthovivens sp.]|nr:valine--tRNA ligase [Candidatus Onthovivens sp.]